MTPDHATTLSAALQLHPRAHVRWGKHTRTWQLIHPDANGEMGCYASAPTLGELLSVIQRKLDERNVNA